MDTEGQKKEIGALPSGNSKPNISLVGSSNFLLKDKRISSIHLKAQKIVSALYMITGLFSNEEPSKWQIRKLGNDLLISIADLIRTDSSASILESKIRAIIVEIDSILEASSFAGLISEMNLAILRKEIFDFSSSILNLRGMAVNGGVRLEQSFFITDRDDSHSLNSGSVEKIRVSQSHAGEVESIKDKSNVLYKNFTDIHEKTQHGLRDFSVVALKKTKRQSSIINLVRKKKEIMVKDVAEIINDCSEKTLQRELLSLVNQGVLKKEGERRWTKYSLVI